MRLSRTDPQPAHRAARRHSLRLGILAGMLIPVLVSTAQYLLEPAGTAGLVVYLPSFCGAILASGVFGLAAGLPAAVLGWLLTVWLFVPPRGQFAIESFEDGLAAIVFLMAALFVSVVAGVLAEVSGEQDGKGGLPISPGRDAED